ncbi:type I-E CRISPR-associated endoribonuclease Cas2e [Bifidobacterium santillanense]|uniref:type I-E CRISPR-associated endoribonuclease Cas2e n=1 Tax=Bifidobacterium santillanense TaxID=2809028 RepID=UPI003B849D9F
MIVIVLTVCPPKLRGHLTRWLFEISPGVYVGKVGARVRELLWEQVLDNIGGGGAGGHGLSRRQRAGTVVPYAWSGMAAGGL